MIRPFTHVCERDRECFEELVLSAERHAPAGVGLERWTALRDPAELPSREMVAFCAAHNVALRERLPDYAPWTGESGVVKMNSFLQVAQGAIKDDWIVHVDSDCLFTSGEILDFLVGCKADYIGFPHDQPVKTTHLGLWAWTSGAFQAVRTSRLRGLPPPFVIAAYEEMTADGLAVMQDDLVVSYILSRAGAILESASHLGGVVKLEDVLLGKVAAKSLIHYANNEKSLLGVLCPRGKSDYPKVMRETLFVDETTVNTLWHHDAVDGRRLVVLSAQRTGREIFRVLALVERLVAPGGAILLALPRGDDARAEATEVFCGAYPKWTRRLIEGHVVELRRMEASGALENAAQRLIDEQEPRRYLDDRRRGARCGCGRPVGHDGECLPASKASPRRCDHVGIGLPDCLICDSRTISQGGPQPDLKRVVSLSLFGLGDEQSGYWRWLPSFIRAHLALFPNYELRVHHDDAIYTAHYGDVLHGLQRRGLVKLVRVAADGLAIGKCQAMLWRLLPLWDPEVSHVFCRDVDSILTWRDRQACEEFVKSRAAFGVVHDDPMHAGAMGGLCHFDAKVWRGHQWSQQWGDSFETVLAGTSSYDRADWTQHGTDQRWLNHVARFAPSTLLHSLFTVPDEIGQPRRRPGWESGLPTSDLRTVHEIAQPVREVILSVSERIRAASDSFINYMGAAHHRAAEAVAFYDEYAPTSAVVREAEQFTRSAP